MPLITLIVTLTLVGLLLWAINVYIPMPPPIKKILNVVVVVVLVIWLLGVFGLLGSMQAINVGR